MVTFTRKDRHNAVSKVSSAIDRGELVRPEECSYCGEYKKTDGHHEDYGKPLEVIWLCRKCHQQRHGGAKRKRNGDRGSYKGTRLPILETCPFQNAGLVTERVLDEHEYWPEVIDWGKFLNQLTFRQREVIKLRYGIGGGDTCTLEEVAKIFRLTRERIRQVEKNAICELRELFEENCVKI